MVLGYDELYADSTLYSTEDVNEGPLNTKDKQEKEEINTLKDDDLHADSEYLNAATETNNQLKNYNPAMDHRKLTQNLREVEIAGKLLLPHKLLGCNCPNGKHNPNTKH